VKLPYLWCIVVLLPQKRFFERFWMNLSSPLTVLYNWKTREETLFWKGSSAGLFFPPKSHRSAFKLPSMKVKRFTFLLVPSNRKSIRPGASPRRKSKSHSIRTTGMRSKILICQRQTVALIDWSLSNQKGAISATVCRWHMRILLRIPVARILWDFDFLRRLAPGRLDGFSIGRYEKKHESFDL